MAERSAAADRSAPGVKLASVTRSAPCGNLGVYPFRRLTMPATGPPRTPEELARLGAEALDRRVRPALRPEDDGKFVAIDIETGDYEPDEDDYAAVTRLRARRPAAGVWLGRVGQPAAYRMRGDPGARGGGEPPP